MPKSQASKGGKGGRRWGSKERPIDSNKWLLGGKSPIVTGGRKTQQHLGFSSRKDFRKNPSKKPRGWPVSFVHSKNPHCTPAQTHTVESDSFKKKFLAEPKVIAKKT